MKRIREFFLRTALVFALAVGFVGAVEAADPPGRIGRIALISGSVETWSPGDKNWAAASLNNPLTSGWAIWADRDGRAEIRIGSSAVHLAGDSQANFTRIDDQAVLVEAARGSFRARVRSLGENDRFLLGADGIQFEVRQPGDFRLDFDPNRRRATLRVFSGQIRILGFGEQMDLVGGQQAEIDTASQRFVSLGAATRNAFDSWVDGRNREQDSQASARYVSPEMTGVEALDDHGRWESSADYGPIWYPRVAVGWAPYRFGHWAWIGPWGWTWIDDAPWGFAPFHYGRWVDFHGRWGWVPGRYERRPVYAPALVGFYGGGPHVGVNVSIGVGNVGWFPLGPAEVYRPAYGASINYVRQVNVSHVTNVTNITNVYNVRPGQPGPMDSYRYARRPDAATFVPGAVFSGARPVGPAFRPVDRGQIGNIPVAQRPVLPERPVGPSPWGAQPARPSPRQNVPMPSQPSRPEPARGADGAQRPWGRSSDEAGHRAPDKTIPAAPTMRPLNDGRQPVHEPNPAVQGRDDFRRDDPRAAGRRSDSGLDNRPGSRPLPAAPTQTVPTQTVPAREVRIRESIPPTAPRAQDASRAAQPRPSQTIETPRAPERAQAPHEVRNPNEGRQVRPIERENQRMEREERRDQRIERDNRSNNRMMQ
ncbi:DUF6600 domain-containing protein [Niveibacterium terrae]|uniref:DUF6600 domain-containing protein n=1 Tax=Niveibacterium terrae TaxID=3373598 RepID=UPI003A930CDD